MPYSVKVRKKCLQLYLMGLRYSDIQKVLGIGSHKTIKRWCRSFERLRHRVYEQIEQERTPMLTSN